MSIAGSVVEESNDKSLGAVYIKDPLKKRKCPLCQQNLYLYHLNYEEMMLMCENLDCDYPFGYEALQVVSDESELRENPVVATDQFSMYPVTNNISLNLDTISMTSTINTTSMLSDMDNTVDSELIKELDETLSVNLRKESKLVHQRRQQKKEMQKRLNNIQQLSNEMIKLSTNGARKRIKTEKLLKNLKKFEGNSGVKLLTDEEAENLNNVKQEYSLGEIKLDIKPGENVPSLNIEIGLKDVN